MTWLLGIGAFAFGLWLLVQALTWLQSNLWVLLIPAGWITVTMLLFRLVGRERAPVIQPIQIHVHHHHYYPAPPPIRGNVVDAEIVRREIQ
jgi:hypothetical protein